MSGVRPGLLGHWDRFVGPGATAVENVGTLALGAAGAVLAPRLDGARPRRPGTRRAVTLQILAGDLWGGAWCNNTPAAARWYGRPGQGAAQHLLFAAAHVHPFVLAALDRQRDPARARLAWAGLHYGYLVAATALVAGSPRRRRRALGRATALGGIGLDRLLGASPSAPWFAPVYYTKLLAGHAAGAAVLPVDPLKTSRRPHRPTSS